MSFLQLELKVGQVGAKGKVHVSMEIGDEVAVAHLACMVCYALVCLKKVKDSMCGLCLLGVQLGPLGVQELVLSNQGWEGPAMD